jgi:hypothetical protein
VDWLRRLVSTSQEPPEPARSESAKFNPPAEQPPLTKQAAISNEYATANAEDLAEQLHDASVFARPPDGRPWDKVDAIYRQRRLLQAEDLITLGFVQKTNRFWGNETFDPRER